MKMKESLFLFDVYDNTTDELVYTGTYDEVEDYIENPGRYTVVWQINGQVM